MCQSFFFEADILLRPPTFGKLVLGGIGLLVVIVFLLDNGAGLRPSGPSRFSRDDHILVIVGLSVAYGLPRLDVREKSDQQVARMKRKETRGRHTLREGLLPRAMVEGGGCLAQISASVTGEGGARLGTLGVASEWFSWELEGSSASLLGTGVMLAGFRLARVVSLRHGDEATADLVADDGGAGELF